MKIRSHLVRGIALVIGLAACAVFNTAQGNHYILPCAPDCRDPADIPIGPAITGSWFNAGQSGQGIVLQVLPGQPLQLMASWFVFEPGGGQTWIIGQGPVDRTRAVLQGYQTKGVGGRFPPAFDQANVRAEFWGTLTFRFGDCDHGRVTWTSTAPGYGSGSMAIERLTMPAGLTCPTDELR